MSDTNTDDPVILHLRERKEFLENVIADSTARLEEINGLLKTLGDGRTRVRRKQKQETPAPRPRRHRPR